MALLRAKTEIQKLKKHRNKSPISMVKVLPNDILVEIMGKVASRSYVDLCKMKFSCKDFLNVSEDGYIYQHASMDDRFALVPLPWFTHEKETTFLKLCKENGNLEILYREAMVQYFSSSMVDLGFENLKKAALEGHLEAKYVYSMVLMANGEDEETRNLGFDLFRELKTSTCVSVARCRKRVKSFIQSMWVKNPVVVQNQLFLCSSNTCCETEKVQKHSKRWYESEYDVDGVGISCKYCDGNDELGLFCNMFRL